jgi:cellulose synthase/poly-beta-1,6-N-acetylglucosamine synthase-like glycosyltransferase
MKPKISATLIVSTYEMPEHLRLVCAALLRQTAADFEIVFADDGSGPLTREILEDFKSKSKTSVQHVWQEHQGFRKCKILNQALRVSTGGTVIFLDGDCVPHRDYVRDHLNNQEPGKYLAGRRVELGPELSARLTPNKIAKGFFDRPNLGLLASVFKGDSEHFQRSLRVSNRTLRQILKMNRIDDLKGCNYSVSREALIALNGFDEAYEGYGREDTDVEIRLQNFGLKIKSMKGLALQFHVWHPRRAFTPVNEDLLESARTTRRVRCERGLG